MRKIVGLLAMSFLSTALAGKSYETYISSLPEMEMQDSFISLNTLQIREIEPKTVVFYQDNNLKYQLDLERKTISAEGNQKVMPEVPIKGDQFSGVIIDRDKNFIEEVSGTIDKNGVTLK